MTRSTVSQSLLFDDWTVCRCCCLAVKVMMANTFAGDTRLSLHSVHFEILVLLIFSFPRFPIHLYLINSPATHLNMFSFHFGFLLRNQSATLTLFSPVLNPTRCSTLFYLLMVTCRVRFSTFSLLVQAIFCSKRRPWLTSHACQSGVSMP